MSDAEAAFVGKSPLDIFDQLRDTYFRYYDTPFRMASEELNRERRRLLDRAGGVWQEPLLELRPRYQVTAEDLAASIANAKASPDVSEVASRGLLYGIPRMYQHQADAFAAAMDGRDVLITAGTGSGKTETFLLPILAALLKDSTSWTGPSAPENIWWREDKGKYLSQREGQTAGRPTAVRAMILYPMNALVDDQLVRLRKALSSDPVTAWLDAHRGGHRFYFGRYTGSTPVLGSQRNGLAVAELRRILKRNEQLHEAARNSSDPNLQFFVPNPLSSEMRSRWDILNAVPDLLITNYSMLNVLLMRARDQHLFGLTRQWLEEESSRIFTLVVDELHMYRGTAGTEIAYLLRNLRDRIGLRDQPERFRILAASASLEPGRDDAFIQEFFAKDRPFEVIRGSLVHVSPAPAGLSAHRERFVGASFSTSGEADRVLNETGADRVIPAAFVDENGSPESIGWREAATRVFGDDAEADDAMVGLLRAMGARTPDAQSPKLRAHYLFRNVPGLWACTDPSCPEVDDPSEDRRVGRLFTEPTTRCPCGARVLELLYCQDCGDAFLGGFTAGSPALRLHEPVSLMADVSEIDRLPDQAQVQRSAENYVVYWPRPATLDDDSQSWGASGFSFRWRPVRLDPVMGEIRVAPAEPTGWQFITQVPKKVRDNGESDRYPAAPTRCPQCGADWEAVYGKHGKRKASDPSRYNSPIRGMRTGFEKINQVLISELVQQMDRQERSLVVFSDSRQDAAKLSSGIALRHYQDLIRLLFVKALEESSGRPDGLEALLKALADHVGTPDFDLMQELSADPAYAPLVQAATRAGYGDEVARTEMQAILDGLSDGVPLPRLEWEVQTKLLELGVNPGGPQPTRNSWASGKGANREVSYWTDLIDWSSAVPAIKPPALLTANEMALRGNIEAGMTEEFIASVNSGAGRDIESLGIAWLTCDRDHEPIEVSVNSDAAIARASLRLLTLRRRIEPLRNQQDLPPRFLRDFWQAAGTHLGIDEEALRDACLRFWGDAVVGYLAIRKKLVARTSSEMWECRTCRRRHLHRGTGVCTRCYAPLPPDPHDPTALDAIQDEDYYAWRAKRDDGLFRLNTAELTGQTDREDAQERQLRFQGVFLGQEDKPNVELTDRLDLLSVTTTMEAGVDIGSLNAVLLANMPPSRFNYQQRVGRAGRRLSPVAHALTICRGRSHDDYYFTNPTRIANEPTPPPYLALQQREILMRGLRSEVMRRAFAGITWDEDDELESMNPHGGFGKAEDWTTNRPRVAAWLNANHAEVGAVIDAFMLGVDASLRPPVGDLVEALLADADRAADQSHGDKALSQRMAGAGMLPMFGFPTQVRYLHLRRPQRSYPWPPRFTIDRESPIAASAFAPGSELVRDGSVYPVAGVAAFSPVGGKQEPKPVPEPLGDPRHLTVCRVCSFIRDGASEELACPQCGAVEEFGSLDMRSPLGFFAEGSRDFEGQFSWSARSGTTRALADLDSLERLETGGLLALSGRGERFVINDRAGRLYGFRKSTGKRWPDGYYNTDELNPELAYLNVQQLTEGDEVRVALGAAQVTDLVFLSPGSPPPAGSGVRIDFEPHYQPSGPRDPWQGRRAAWYSFAFLAREAAAVLLDVQPMEFSAGIHVGAGDLPVRAFLADFLENGAGFSTWLGSPAGARDWFAKMDSIASSWADPMHAETCLASCYDCLRDYHNMAYHPLLDWRLGRDLLSYCRTGSLDVPADYGRTSLEAWAEAVGGRFSEIEGGGGFATIETNGTRVAVIVRHALEAFDNDEMSDRLVDAMSEAEASGVDATVAVDAFTLDRQPRDALILAKSVTSGSSW